MLSSHSNINKSFSISGGHKKSDALEFLDVIQAMRKRTKGPYEEAWEQFIKSDYERRSYLKELDSLYCLSFLTFYNTFCDDIKKDGASFEGVMEQYKEGLHAVFEAVNAIEIVKLFYSFAHEVIVSRHVGKVGLQEPVCVKTDSHFPDGIALYKKSPFSKNKASKAVEEGRPPLSPRGGMGK